MPTSLVENIQCSKALIETWGVRILLSRACADRPIARVQAAHRIHLSYTSLSLLSITRESRASKAWPTVTPKSKASWKDAVPLSEQRRSSPHRDETRPWKHSPHVTSCRCFNPSLIQHKTQSCSSQPLLGLFVLRT